MNSLAFDVNKEMVEEWKDVYLNQEEIGMFEEIIDQACMYLQVINNNKNKNLGKSQPSLSQINVQSNPSQINDSARKTSIKSINSRQDRHLKEWISQIKELKTKFLNEYQQSLKAYAQKQKSGNIDLIGDNPLNFISMAFNKVIFHKKIEVCQNHLQQLKQKASQFYHNFLTRECELIEHFVKYKLRQLRLKYNRLINILKYSNQQQTSSSNVRMLYDNLFIQTDYLKKMISLNVKILQEHLSQKQFSNQNQNINEIRQNQLSKIMQLLQKTESLKQSLRYLYFSNFKKKKSKRIKDHSKLQSHIISQIATNQDEYVQNNSTISFINGFVFAMLFFALIVIFLFRQYNISTLQQNSSYMTRFRIWRGASYLIYFNWILGIVFYLLNKFKINYKLILIEDDTFVPKHQSFFFSATIMSAIYLFLFAVYILKQLGTIQNYYQIYNMGYYMWIINIVFLLNPFKIMNYEGRRYFLKLFVKTILTLFRPMNMNIFFLAIIIGSFVQPFSDFAFTICQVAYQQESDCLFSTQIATFIFTMVFLVYRFVQSIRSHRQFGAGKTFSRPILGIIAVSFSMNTVISSLFYNLYKTQNLLIYWIISASFSTIAGINADLRADWGFISFDEQDCLLRKFKRFPRKVYFIIIVIDIVLNIGWVLTISNSMMANFGIPIIYFLMILSYVELARKGMWMFFRLEDDHSLNVGNLQALLDDTHIYLQIQQANCQKQRQPQKQTVIQPQQSFQIILQTINQNQVSITVLDEDKKYKRKNQFAQILSVLDLGQTKTLRQLQMLIIDKKDHIQTVNIMLKQLKDYLQNIHSIYQRLDWQDEY